MKEHTLKRNAISLQSSVVGRANLRMYIRAAQEAGFDCIEPTKTQPDWQNSLVFSQRYP